MNRIEFGDCRETMRRWASEGVKAQMCVTSPPYFGLRQYFGNAIRIKASLTTGKRAWVEQQLREAGANAMSDVYLKSQLPEHLLEYFEPAEIGLEETPEQYIAAMVEVFRCVRDVLADDGTLWLNIGDSYAGSGKGPAGNLGKTHNERHMEHATSSGLVPEGCKPKDLIGIPWTLAFALRADGWFLRQDIIWHKPNPMPESVRDRCTKAHEYIFLLSKSKNYYYDHESIKYPCEPTGTRNRANGKYHNEGSGLQPHSGLEKSYETANKRSVWSVKTKPFSGAHFATFPTELIEPCIKAGSPVGGVVLDPFMGSGTTAQVALQLQRQYLGCELNPDYKVLQEKRIALAKGGIYAQCVLEFET
jgi:DNA modification methylase